MNKHKETKQIDRIVSRGKHIFEMHAPTLGNNAKPLETIHARK